MSPLDAFQHELRAAIREIVEGQHPPQHRVEYLLNGAAGNAVALSLSKSARAKDGIFFSGQSLSQRVAALLESRLNKGATVADPTCGAGDLLLACMSLAPTGRNLRETLAIWSKQVSGFDIHGEFVQTARQRLALLAAERHRSDRSTNAEANADIATSFSSICESDYFAAASRIVQVDCVVMNPPYYDAEAASDCTWATGKTQIAARFVESVILHGKLGQEVIAVLPDVLRSGSRYAKWRAFVERFAEVLSADAYGRFDEKTDVDVFVLHVRKRRLIEASCDRTRANWNIRLNAGIDLPNAGALCLSNFFQVTVGSVVPHRHIHGGAWFSYISVATAPPGGEVRNLKKIRTTGTVHQAPFVVIRRTSSPSDARRIVATLVSGRSYFAVENHLIVLSPNDSKLSSCRRLVVLLARQYVHDWVNAAIRCRHLTTSTMKQLPLSGWTA